MNNFPDLKSSPLLVSISQVQYGKPFRLGPDCDCRIYYLGDHDSFSFNCYYVQDFELVEISVPDDAYVLPL